MARPIVSDKERRKNRVGCRLTDGELEKLDNLRGKISRGEFMRLAMFQNAPKPVPKINLQAAALLRNALGNLATLAAAMRKGHYAELQDCRRLVHEVRSLLRGIHIES